MWVCSALSEMGLGTIKQTLPDGGKSLLHYCQVSGILAEDFTSGLFLRLCGVRLIVNNSCNSRLAFY